MGQTRSQPRGTKLRVRKGSLLALCGLATLAHGGEPAHLRQVNTLDLDSLFALPEPVLPPPSLEAPSESPQALSFVRKVEHDDLNVLGFLASRATSDAADYRVYLGFGYSRSLGDDTRLTGRTFYGAGTYDGANDGTALPDEVRASSAAAGGWMGSNWRLESRLSPHHVFSADIEYGQRVALVPVELNELLGRSLSASSSEPERRVGIVTRNQFTLSPELSLNVKMRYDQDDTQNHSSIDPRVELLYKPRENTTLRARFDQMMGASPAEQRAWHPWVTADEDSDRVRNYELALERRLTSKHKLLLSAYRYDVDGLFAEAADAGSPLAASIDTTGFEVGMERNGNHTRARISYAWQKTKDWLLGDSASSLGQHLTKLSMSIPLLRDRFTTAFELKYLDVTGALAGNHDGEYLIGNVTLASGKLAGDTRISLGMHNVFDVQDNVNGARLLSYIPADGRNLRLDISRTL
ncbi:MAG: TonB-dependent receptor [Steroidobacteraceae bacterium]|nr:TonB-dependent receptor [Steroidobacteraceae bacterium]